MPGNDEERQRFSSGREKTDSRFWIISVVFHGALAVVILLSPVGQSMFTRERTMKPEIVRKNEELAEVVEDIRDLAVDRLKEQVSLLEAGQDRMAMNFETMNAHYQPFVEKQLLTAQARFEQEAKKTLERQTTVRDHALAAHEDENKFPQLRATLDEHEARIVSGMEEVRRSLRLLAPENEALFEELKGIEDAQLNAFQFFGWSYGTHSGIVRNRAKLAELEKKIPEAAAQLKSATDTMAAMELALKTARAEEDAAKKAAGDAKNQLRDMKKETQQAKSALDKAKKSKDEAAIQAAQQAYNAAVEKQKAAEQAEKDAQARLKKAGQDKKTKENERRNFERELRKIQDSHPKMLAEQKKINESMAKNIESRNNNIRIGSSIQRGVVDRHTAFIEKLRKHLNEAQQADANKAEEGARQ